VTTESAALYSGSLLHTSFAKTTHGVLRGSERFSPVVIIDPQHAGKRLGDVLRFGDPALPISASLTGFVDAGNPVPKYFVVGMAFSGGRLPTEHRGAVLEALRLGCSVVSGLHQQLGEDPELVAAASQAGGAIIDVRRVPDLASLHFWTGEIHSVRALKIPVLGIDCAIGKRTTAWLLLQACRAAGLRAEMVYTGQTGWMQGLPYGFILDCTPNDFVSGELEHAVVCCNKERSPDVIFIEGQAALRHPAGPCGAELIVSAAADAVIVQHVPGREYFEDFEALRCRLPDIQDEVKLIEHYGAPVIGLVLNGSEMSADALRQTQAALARALGRPVVIPGADDLAPLLAGVSELLERKRRSRPGE
jgi:uncharacterized NAD-dependent epimerase/dehydratase family protein